MRKLVLSITGVSILLVLSGCLGSASTEEKIYDVLEETVTLEKPFVEQQEDISTKEKREKEIFEEISLLTSDEMEDIKTLAQEAIEGIEDREGYIETEKESMDKSREEFKKVSPLIKDIEDEAVKKEAEGLVEVMNSRYEKFDELHTIYKETLGLEKDLYTLLESEDSEMTDVTDKIIDLNENYEMIMESNELFNEKTALYNDQKEAFYKATELNISFEEN